MRLWVFSAALWFCGGLSVAGAQEAGASGEGTPTAEAPRDAEARALFDAGEVAYASGHYEDALLHFRRSHELSGRDILLFNIGAAAERLRRDAEAVDAYTQYLTALPSASNRDEVEARMLILENAIDQDAQSAASISVEPTQKTRVVTWVSAGLAVAFAGLAVTAWFVGDRKFDDLADECRAGCTQQRVDASTVPRWDRLTNASIGVSIAAAVSATLFFFIETKDADNGVAVGVSPGGISLRGSF